MKIDEFEKLHKTLQYNAARLQDMGLLPLSEGNPDAFALLGLPRGSYSSEALSAKCLDISRNIRGKLAKRSPDLAAEFLDAIAISRDILSSPELTSAYLDWFEAKYGTRKPTAAQERPKPPQSETNPPPPQPGTRSPLPATGFHLKPWLFWSAVAFLFCWRWPSLRFWIGGSAAIIGGLLYYTQRSQSQPATWFGVALGLIGACFFFMPRLALAPIANPPGIQGVPQETLEARSNREALEAKDKVIQVENTIRYDIDKKSKGQLPPEMAQREQAEIHRLCASALQLANDALTLRPDNRLAYLAQGYSLYYTDRYADASESAARALRKFPRDKDLLYLQGWIRKKVARKAHP